MMRWPQLSNVFGANVLGHHLATGMCVSFAGHQQCSISAHESFALPPQMKEFPRRPDASAVNESIPLFYIGQNWKGAWVVREAEGRSGGLFLFKQSAVRFARRQCEPAGCAIMFLVEPVELDLDNEGRWAVPLSTIKKAPQASLVSQLIHAAVGVWRKIIVVVSHNVAALKRNRAAAERELFGGRYTLSSKNDDDLPIVR